MVCLELLQTLLMFGNCFSRFPNEYRYFSQEKKTITILVPMSTTWLYENGYSPLVEIKSKKRNAIKDVDILMRGTLQTRLILLYISFFSLLFTRRCIKWDMFCWLLFISIVYRERYWIVETNL